VSDEDNASRGPQRPDPDSVLRLLHGVRQGRVFDLAQPVSPRSPHLPVQPPFRMETNGVRLSDAMGSALDTQVFAEHIQMTLHVGTHVDALGHFAADGHWCHGTPAGVDPSGSGVAHHGIETLGPMIARAVVIDIARWAGLSRLEAGTPVTAAMLRSAASAQGVGVEPGDVVLVRTGWEDHYMTDNARYVSGEPGLDEDAARYLSDRGVAAIGADNMALEVMPFAEPHRPFPVHRHLLAEAGVHIIENLRLKQVCAAGAHTGLFMLFPIPFVGGTASPATPVIIT